jgi:hypothetical protein
LHFFYINASFSNHKKRIHIIFFKVSISTFNAILYRNVIFRSRGLSLDAYLEEWHAIDVERSVIKTSSGLRKEASDAASTMSSGSDGKDIKDLSSSTNLDEDEVQSLNATTPRGNDHGASMGTIANSNTETFLTPRGKHRNEFALELLYMIREADEYIGSLMIT